MKKHPAAIRYARALLNLTTGKEQAVAIRRDCLALAALLKQSPELRIILRDAFAQLAREKALKALFEERMEPLLFRFLIFLSRKRRSSILADVLTSYDQLFCDQFGIAQMAIDSAIPLDEAQLKALTLKMESRLGKTVETTVRINPGLIAGFRMRLNDMIYDYTVDIELRHLLRRMCPV